MDAGLEKYILHWMNIFEGKLMTNWNSKQFHSFEHMNNTEEFNDFMDFVWPNYDNINPKITWAFSNGNINALLYMTITYRDVSIRKVVIFWQQNRVNK
jgi:hypothetical protein